MFAGISLPLEVLATSQAPQSNYAGQAALFLNPGSGTFLVGSTFNLSVVLDTKGNSINTAEIEILFSSDKVQLANPSVGQSIIQLWPAPPSFSNKEGRIYFVGGIPSPGIVTSDGIVLTLTFRVVAPGDAEIKFGDQTGILANDGRGTDILGQKPSAFFKFLVPPPQGPVVFSPTHSDQERWYKDNNPTFIWQKVAFANAFSYGIDHDPSGSPDTVSEGIASTASFNNLDSGIWYFHLRAGSDGAWGGVSHYVAKIDNQPPAAFTVNVSPGKRTANRNPIFRFFSTDSLSGFSHFEMKMIRLSGIDASEALFYEISSPYQAINIEPGRYQVVIRAYDNALNSKDENVTLNILGPFSKFIDSQGIDLIIFFLPWRSLINILSLILIIFLIMIFFLWREHKHHLNDVFTEDIERTFSSAKNLWQEIKKLLHISVILIILGIVFTGSYSTVAMANELNAPEISVIPAQYYPLDEILYDEILYIEGRAAPRSKVAVNFEKSDAKSVTVIVESNSNGEWFLGQKVELSSGEWTTRARVLGDPASDWSNPRIIQSRVTGFIFGSIKIRYLPITIALTLLLSASAVLLWYLLWRISKIRRSEHIRRDIADELEHLEKSIREGRELSDAEMKRRENLLAELRHAEEIISDKFNDIS